MSTSTPAVAPVPMRRHAAYLQEARCELMRLLREPAFCIPVIVFPAMFYLLFAVLLNRGSAAAAQYLLATYGVFGVMGAAMFGFGVTIATDRERGYLRLRRALPGPPGAMLLAKIAMAMLFAAMISLLLGTLAFATAGVRLPPAQWLGLLAVNMAGVLPFAAIGLYTGSLLGSNSAPVVLNLLYLPMSFLSGLWIPLTMLPDWLAAVAPVWPAYHLSQLALKVVGHDAGTPAWQHALVLAGVAALFYLLARRRLSAAE